MNTLEDDIRDVLFENFKIDIHIPEDLPQLIAEKVRERLQRFM